MRYQFGEFLLHRPEASLSGRRTAVREESDSPADESLPQRLTEIPAPDLFHALEDWQADRPWALELHSTLWQLELEGAGPYLLDCDWNNDPPGHLVVVGVAQSAVAEVRVGDVVHAGFVAARIGDQAPAVWQRSYRRVCANGTLADLQHSTLVAGESGLGAAVHACLGREAFHAQVARYRAAAQETVEDPLLRLRRADVPIPRETVLLNFRRGGDASLWGLVNAVTAAARELPDWPARLAAERSAMSLLLPGIRAADPGRRGRNMEV
ncbi:MAG: hypothetical protein EYC70_11440 [Planctomycetota bacterium]|nr:MAG: hypothetical protein EYC70_11440 [Planctomycetota bacterium]